MDREFILIERQGGWQALFQKLYQIAKMNAGSQAIAKKPMNVIRNRYRDVLPIDSTRVCLDNPDNDYINANFVQDEDTGRKYILCQGPLQHTTPHFWQMIWEQNSVGIIMLNKCVERGMNKCFPYWPRQGEPPMDLGGAFTVENVGFEESVSYQLTRLSLTRVEDDQSREILHFHYTRWPDFGVPQNPEVFLDYLYAVRTSGVLEGDKGPAVVHCSAGIGRSGTFCIVDTLLAKLEKTMAIDSADLQTTLLAMREQRLGLVQTADQLRFSYIAVLQGALQDLGVEPSDYEGLMGDLEEEEEGDEEKVETEESDEDEDEEDEEKGDEDPEARLNRKYPNLNRQGSASSVPVVDADDVPPPLPPRPPETLQPQPDEEEEAEDLSESEGEADEVGIAARDDGASPMLSSEPPPPPPPTSAPPPSTSPPVDSPVSPPLTPPPAEPVVTSSPSKKIKLTSNISFSDDDILDFRVSADPAADADKVLNPEESPFVSLTETPHVFENGALDESLSDEVEDDDDEDEVPVPTTKENPEPPPPIPPRNHSLSPGPATTYLHDYMHDDTGKIDIYNSEVPYPWIKDSSATTSTSSGSFLSEGRGGERANPPPLMTNGITASAATTRTTNGTSSSEGSADDVTEEGAPPPIPSKVGRKKSGGQRLEEITEEEKALVGELDLLEKLMETKHSRKSDTTPLEALSSEALPSEAPPPEEDSLPEASGFTRPEINADEVKHRVEDVSKGAERRQLRSDRRARLEETVQGIKDNMRKNEQGYESDWSIPWLLVGFVVMLGYCAYYIIH